MAFIEPMHRNKPNITYLLTYTAQSSVDWLAAELRSKWGLDADAAISWNLCGGGQVM